MGKVIYLKDYIRRDLVHLTPEQRALLRDIENDPMKLILIHITNINNTMTDSEDK